MWTPIDQTVFARHFDPASRLDRRQLRDAGQRFFVRTGDTFQFDRRAKRVGDIEISLNTISPFRSLPMSIAVGRDVHIGFLLRGTLHVQDASTGSVRWEAPAAYVLSAWGSAEVQAPQIIRTLDLRVPREALEKRGIDTHAAHRFLKTRGAGTSLRLFAAALLDTPASVSAGVETDATQSALLDLIEGLFIAHFSLSAAERHITEELRVCAVAHILAEHRDPGLTPASIAAELGVSLRHLQRAFAEADMSLAGIIASTRAESAAKLLSTPDAARMSLREIAGHSGFPSVFMLRSAFRERYGILPSAFRDGARVQIHDIRGADPRLDAEVLSLRSP